MWKIPLNAGEQCPVSNLNIGRLLAEANQWHNMRDLLTIGDLALVSHLDLKLWNSPSQKTPRPSSNASICIHWRKASLLILNGKLVTREFYYNAYEVLTFDLVMSKCLLDLFMEGAIKSIRRRDLEKQKSTCEGLLKLKIFKKQEPSSLNSMSVFRSQ